MTDIDGETWDDWVFRHFEHEYCAECNGDAEHHEPVLLMGHWFARCKNALRVPRADEIVVWAVPFYDGGGFYDAWNGWYYTETEALTDAPGSLPVVHANGAPDFTTSPRTLYYGETLMSLDELEDLGRA